MASYNDVLSDPNSTGAVIDATGGFTTPWINVKNAFAFSISTTFGSDAATNTGTPAGTLVLQCSNEPPISAPVGGLTGRFSSGVSGTPAWSQIIGSGTSIAYAGYGEQPRYNGLDAVNITQPVTTLTTVVGTGTVFYDLAQRGFHWVREVYTSTGTGTARINVEVKW